VGSRDSELFLAPGDGGGSVTDSYTYNWQGLRTRAYLNGTYYRYLYNGERVLQELTDAGAVTATYTTENDSYYGTLLHLKRATGESRFPLYDEIGSARGLVDAGGTVTDTYDMDTFGKPITTTGSTPNPYRFGGAWGYITDPSGFLQLGARYYWPEVGRFVSQDPMQDDANWYVYAKDNPVGGIDPEGLWTPDPCDQEYRERVRQCRREYCRNRPKWDPNSAKISGGFGALGGALKAARTRPCPGPWGFALSMAAGAAMAVGGDYAVHKTQGWWALSKLGRCMAAARDRRQLCKQRRHNRPLGYNGNPRSLLW